MDPKAQGVFFNRLVLNLVQLTRLSDDFTGDIDLPQIVKEPTDSEMFL